MPKYSGFYFGKCKKRKEKTCVTYSCEKSISGTPATVLSGMPDSANSANNKRAKVLMLAMTINSWPFPVTKLSLQRAWSPKGKYM